MNIELVRSHCLSKLGTTEEFPFDEKILVFKVLGKMFAASNITSEEFMVNLKCDPERAIQLREAYDDIRPGFHMNKKHWNSMYCEGSLNDDFILELIDHSYALVVKGLKRSDRDSLGFNMS